MRSSFFGLDVGLRALLAQQKALDVTGHNIANAHTQGFSRQRVTLSARVPAGHTSMHRSMDSLVGGGVDAGKVLRLRDALLDHRYRAAHSSLSEWTSKYNVLDQIQHVLAEPSDLGIGGAMDRFWSALQELGNQPESIAARRALIEAGNGLSDIVNQIHHGLTLVRASLAELLRSAVGEVNSIVADLQEINKLVVEASAQGDEPSDLMDKRDLLIDRLSALIGTTVQTEPHGEVTVFCGSHRIVDIAAARSLEMDIDVATGTVTISWADSDAEFVPAGGEIKGLLAGREEYVSGFMEDLELLVSTFVSEFNSVHRQGFGLDGLSNRDFFTPGTTAGTMSMSLEVLADPARIGASLSGEAGDGGNVLQLAAIRFEPVVNNTSIDDYFNSIVSRLGTMVQRADGAVESNSNIKRQIEVRRESVAGVSLDEEMTNLLRYQHAYAAAARFITTVDDMLDTIINRLGR